VHNFKVGVAERLGIDHDSLLAHNPKIISARATGLGERGPDAALAVYDILGLARSGAMNALRYPGASLEYTGAFGLADQAGALLLAQAITMALLARERFGCGQDVEISQLGAQMMLQHMALTRHLINGGTPPSMPRSQANNPLFSVYRCGDDKWLALGALQADRHWPDLCETLGLESVGDDGRFASMQGRSENSAELVSLLDKAFQKQSRDYWLEQFAGRDIPSAPVNDYDDLCKDPQVAANDYIAEVEHPVAGPVREVGVPIKMSKTPGSVKHAAPEFGQHTEEVLLEAGFSWDDITALHEAGAV
jgi:crotonobetainyl-CoA:carnitine CoA-transferase CaiB-like acyl-CoA transferase